MPVVAGLQILPLTPERWDDLAALFKEGGDPRWCWCMYLRLRAKDFAANTVAQNRDALRALAGDDPAPGLLAYRGGRVVGWVSLGPRAGFERIKRSRVIPKLDDRPVWSIVCFAVSEAARGEGVARALLRGAIDYARERGAPAVEAYPVDTRGQRIGSGAAYTGTLPMFLAAGFQVVRMTDSVSGGAPRPIVRRGLSENGQPGGD
jgi:ribosomal protein S18 acetylase RimI-like enzyme